MRKAREMGDFAMFVLPAFLLICIASYIPFFMNLHYAQTDWDGISSVINHVGGANFVKLLQDHKFWGQEALFTFKYLIVYMLGVNVTGLCAALLFVQKFKTANLMRGLFYIPHVISLIMIGYVWKFIFSVGAKSIFKLTGWPFFAIDFLGDRSVVFYTMMCISIWYAAGYYAVIYIAGLKSVPTDILEAADIDGASRWHKFWHVKFPMIAPSVTVCCFTSTLGGLKVFDLPLVLTSGGPAGYTTSIALSIYRDAYANHNYGYAIAKSLVFFVMVMVVTLLQLKFTKSREVEA